MQTKQYMQWGESWEMCRRETDEESLLRKGRYHEGFSWYSCTVCFLFLSDSIYVFVWVSCVVVHSAGNWKRKNPHQWQSPSCRDSKSYSISAYPISAIWDPLLSTFQRFHLSGCKWALLTRTVSGSRHVRARWTASFVPFLSTQKAKKITWSTIRKRKTNKRWFLQAARG